MICRLSFHPMILSFPVSEEAKDLLFAEHETNRAQTPSTDGAEIAEAALVLPLVFMLLLGIIWFGRAFNIYSTIQQAAQQGAIVAARRRRAPHAGSQMPSRTCHGGQCGCGGDAGVQPLDPGQIQTAGQSSKFWARATLSARPPPPPSLERVHRRPTSRSASMCC